MRPRGGCCSFFGHAILYAAAADVQPKSSKATVPKPVASDVALRPRTSTNSCMEMFHELAAANLRSCARAESHGPEDQVDPDGPLGALSPGPVAKGVDVQRNLGDASPSSGPSLAHGGARRDRTGPAQHVHWWRHQTRDKKKKKEELSKGRREGCARNQRGFEPRSHCILH